MFPKLSGVQFQLRLCVEMRLVAKQFAQAYENRASSVQEFVRATSTQWQDSVGHAT